MVTGTAIKVHFFYFLCQLSSSIEGVNWYSILRAEKTSSTEAIVLAVMVDKGNLFSLAVLVSLAEYLSSKDTYCFVDHVLFFCLSLLAQPFWAKDIIFLATNGGQYGMQAWLEAYLGIKSSGNATNCTVKPKGIANRNL